MTFPPQPHKPNEGEIGKPKTRKGSLRNKCSLLCKTVQVLKGKERQGNCSQIKQTKQTHQLDAICRPGVHPGLEKVPIKVSWDKRQNLKADYPIK